MAKFLLSHVTRESFGKWLRGAKSPKKFVAMSACKCPIAAFVNSMQPEGRTAAVTQHHIRLVTLAPDPLDVPLYDKQYKTPIWARDFMTAFDAYGDAKNTSPFHVSLTNNRAQLILESLS